MKESAKVSMVKTLVMNDAAATDEVINVYLSLAYDRLMDRIYPFGKDGKYLPDQYESTQCELAARMFLRRGAEGEVNHSENGVARTYRSVDDNDLLARVTPYCEVR